MTRPREIEGVPIDLQKRADDLALRLTGNDRLLIWELCRRARELADRLETVKRAVG